MAADAQKIRETSMECLRRWAAFSEKYWWDAPDRPGLGCFGTGYNQWGVQANQKYLGAMAVLATDDEDWEQDGFTREKALERALAAFRFSLASHQTGDYRCTDGTQWGRTWISGLGIERMMHGVELLDPHLEPSDRERLAELLADEADHQLTTDVVAGLWARDGRNRPESNIWNGAICARAAFYCPQHPHAADWAERANLFFVNAISVPADAEDDTVIEGKPVREWYAGANFFPNYALDHHGYLNTGYMVICLSNIAMLHYGFVLRGAEAPAPLYRHAHELWGLVKRLISPRGRLLRIGGDTRIRYCYCQDYVAPTLVFAADHWADPHALELLAGAVEIARFEQSTNSDGAFLSGRLEEVRRRSPYYYTRLESDRAVVLSQAACWLARREIAAGDSVESFEESVTGGWEEPDHGAVFHRSDTRLASFSWRAAEAPQALCLPPRRDDMAEWMENLAGNVQALGEGGHRDLVRCSIHSFADGFLTFGETTDGAGVRLPEGWQAESTARHFLVFAALPDGHTCLRMEWAVTAPRRVFLAGWTGVKLEIPNDIFNGCRRWYASEGGVRELASHFGEPQVVDLKSAWVNIDDSLGLIGVYGAESWSVLRRGKRTGGHAFGNILTDVLCLGIQRETYDVYGETVLLDNACVIMSSADAETTRKAYADETAKRLPCSPEKNCRAVLARGTDSREYLLVSNFTDERLAVSVEAPAGTWEDLATTDQLNAGAALEVALSAGTARLFVRL